MPQTATAPFCPSEVRGRVEVPRDASAWRKWWIICGPALLVSIGYMDPGNWVTDIAAGTQFGYQLLCIILLANLAAMFLQSMTAKVGIITGKDLAQLSRAQYGPKKRFLFWLLAELAIVACDVAEVLGTALALHLLTGCSLVTGILLTMLDTIIVLGLKGRGYRQLEAIILGLLITIAVCFGIEMVLASPDMGGVAKGLVPSFDAINSADKLYLAIGIIGATVMPHNLYLHSSLVQTRAHAPEKKAQKEAIYLNRIDTVVALGFAFFINGAILVLAASAFHGTEVEGDIAGIEDAYRLLTPMLGAGVASLVFGIALFACGQSSTFTGTIAGQVILQGFLELRWPCWAIRLMTRSLALVPALGGILILGDEGIDTLMIASQVVLGLQLPFVMMPLLKFASSKKLMGEFAIGWKAKLIGWILFAAITSANLWLIYQLAVGE